MVQKRPVTDEEVEEDSGDSALRRAKRQQPILNAVREVMRLPSNETLPYVLEPFLRKVVQEEVEKSMLGYMSSNSRTTLSQTATQRRWRLQFKNKLPHTLFAGSRIEAEDSSPVEITMTDTFSNTVVTFGPLSSAKVEIVVLDGDFRAEDLEHWTEKGFIDSLVREREGRRPLLTGEIVLTLREGTGCFGDMKFTDNSSWIRSRRFRLGVRVQSCFIGVVQEGVSGAFLVKDHRGELYKKHYPPLPGDEVWRLKKIGKDGAFHTRLTENGITTVQDFLKLFVVNPEKLRNILGPGMSSKIWEATIQHALQCDIENKLYCYYILGQQVALYFDSIFRFIGVKFDDSCSLQYSQLNLQQKVLVDRWKHVAYMNQKDMVEIDELPISFTGSLLMTESGSSSRSTMVDLPTTCLQDELANETTFNHSLHPTYEDPSQWNDISNIQKLHQVQQFPPLSINNFSTGKLLDGQLEGMLNCLQFSPECDLGNGFFHAPDSDDHNNSPTSFVPPSHSGQVSSSNWVKLMAVMKCRKMIQRRLAKRRNQHVSYQSRYGFPSSV